MFNTIARHATFIQPLCTAAMSRFTGQAAARLPVTRALRPAWTSSVSHGADRLLASRAVRLIPMRAMATTPGSLHRYAFGTPASLPQRDWPDSKGEPHGERIGARTGQVARQASLRSEPTLPELSIAQDLHARWSGDPQDPKFGQMSTRMGMLEALERSRDQVVFREGPGVGAGLRHLAIEPGDAVGDQDAPTSVLPTRLAADGVKTVVAMTADNRVRAYSQELDRFRQGRTQGFRECGPDLKPIWPEQHYIDSARTVARNMTVVPGSGFSTMPPDIRYKALMARCMFEHMDMPAIEAAVTTAGRLLAPGGGLVFDFAHAAGRPVPASAGVQLTRFDFKDIENALKHAGLSLRELYITFREPGYRGRCLIPTRRVVPDASGRIDLRQADAAAWSGWNEVFEQHGALERPVQIDVSGVFVKGGREGQD